MHGNQGPRQSVVCSGGQPTAVGVDFHQGAMQSLDEEYLGGSTQNRR